MDYWPGEDELQLGLAVGPPDPQSPQSTSQDQQYLPFRLNIVNNVIPELDFTIETGNIRFSPDIHEWVGLFLLTSRFATDEITFPFL